MEAREKIAHAISQVESSTNFEIIAEIKAAMNSVYGEERNQIIKPTVDGVLEGLENNGVDMTRTLKRMAETSESWTVDYLKNYPFLINYQCIIYFPEINITNSAKHKHTIKDIYVRFAIRPNGTLYSALQGIRATVSEEEYSSGYLHSHLHSLDRQRIIFTTFCTGVGEINQVISLLNVSYSQANLMMFLMHIKNYLQWESREGTPYIQMQNIFSRTTRVRHQYLSDITVLKASDRLIKSAWLNLNSDEIMDILSFSISEKGISVKPTAKTEKWLATEMERWGLSIQHEIGSSISDMLCVKDAEGRYHDVPDNDPVRIRDCKKTILKFKGQEIKFQVTKKQEVKKNETFANPKITEKFCEKLSHILTRTAITTPGIKSGDSLIYNSRTPEPDNLPVQESLDGRMVGDALL